jgi:uncharacterized BrkB/YihY/UPF0761 family membrane protein
MSHKLEINSPLSSTTESIWHPKQQRGLTILKLMNIVAIIGILIVIVLLMPIN